MVSWGNMRCYRFKRVDISRHNPRNAIGYKETTLVNLRPCWNHQSVICSRAVLHTGCVSYKSSSKIQSDLHPCRSAPEIKSTILNSCCERGLGSLQYEKTSQSRTKARAPNPRAMIPAEGAGLGNRTEGKRVVNAIGPPARPINRTPPETQRPARYCVRTRSLTPASIDGNVNPHPAPKPIVEIAIKTGDVANHTPPVQGCSHKPNCDYFGVCIVPGESAILGCSHN